MTRTPQTAARPSRNGACVVVGGRVAAGCRPQDPCSPAPLLKLGTWVPMMGNIGILSVMALVSVAIIKYFATTAKDGQHWWTTLLAPALATVAMGFVTFLLIKYRTTLAGGVNPPFVEWVWVPPPGLFLAGPLPAPASRRASLLRLAREAVTAPELWELAEGLLEHDSQSSQWRSRHVDMVERQIGTKSGTGGSSGAPYLRSRLDLRYYPELWELRSYL